MPSSFSVYFHIPFCLRKCPYCDFYSVAGEQEHIDAYVAALERQLASPMAGGFQTDGICSSVFFGGGTPSLMTPFQVGRLLDAVARRFGFTADAEITLEANPGTVTPEKLAGWRAAGVNRLSLGAQSFDDRQLTTLGRIHNAADIVQGIHWARDAGFSNLNLDLIFGLAGQKARDLEKQLAQALDFAPQHLSLYGLGIEAGTPFGALEAQGARLSADEEDWERMYLSAHELLTAHGFHHYEISNYALAGCECRHNLRYWCRGTSLGIGAGAHGFSAQDYGVRYAVPADWQGYVRGELAPEEIERFDRRQAMAETLYLGLRTAEGVSLEDFEERFGLKLEEAFPRELEQSGAFLEEHEERLRMRLSGWLIYDTLIQRFL
jgi:oxygen-independent coproporphyrinogen-3 oxidase